MPGKGSKLKYGNRNYIFNIDFYNENLVEKRGVTLSFNQCKSIIEKCNKNIANIIVEENDGFKMPFGLGYMVAGKYKPTNPIIDWKKSNESGKRVYHLNLHTFGYAVKIYWFRVGRIYNTRFHEVYKFAPYKTLSIAVSKAFGTGKRMYGEWCTQDFIEKGRVQNLMNKKYQPEYKQ